MIDYCFKKAFINDLLTFRNANNLLTFGDSLLECV